MSLTIKLWNQSSAYVTLNPEWATKEDMDKIWNLNRSPSGNATLFTYATFRIWSIPCRMVPASDAAFMNTLYSQSRVAQLELIRDGVSQVHSVTFIGNKSPFQENEIPDVRYFKGELALSAY
jgi:hypothetical protein